MKNTAKTIATMVLALSLAMPLAACGGQASSDSADSSVEQTSTEAAAVDVTSWKTLGDALAVKDGDYSSAGWDESHYVQVFDAGERTIRVVAKMDSDTYQKTNELDATMEDYDEQFAAAVGGLELESAEDITDAKIAQEELDAYVGKTGQDLIDAGFTFESYYMYGGDETGATMVNGYFAYSVTFDVNVPEDKTEDEGAAIKDATITAIECSGAADSAVDPTNL